MNYLKILQNSYDTERRCNECAPQSPLEYLGEYIFDFTTYDGEMSALFAQKAVEVCNAIATGTTLDYIKDAENYRWYLVMCNMPFFASRLEWGTSIRGAWWDHTINFQSCGLWDGNRQLADDMTFTTEEWTLFMAAVSEFSQANVRDDRQLPRDFASLFASGRPEDWQGFEETLERWRNEVMTTEQIYNISKQPFPSCISIDQTVGFLTRALKALEHAPESKDVDRARTLIEEGIADAEGYREIHSNMRAWGQGWKDAFLEANKQKAAIFAQLVSLQAGSRRATLEEIAESVREKYDPEYEREGIENG